MPDAGHCLFLTILTYAERQKYWNWCRGYIDREAIYRVDETHPEIPGKAGGKHGCARRCQWGEVGAEAQAEQCSLAGRGVENQLIAPPSVQRLPF